MKASELRKMTFKELQALGMDLLREQFNLRMQKGTDQLTKSSEIKRVRREIARVKTVIVELKYRES